MHFFPILGASSDLAYETMYDDDEIMNQKQTMPWFDPKYLASKEDDEVFLIIFSYNMAPEVWDTVYQ